MNSFQVLRLMASFSPIVTATGKRAGQTARNKLIRLITKVEQGKATAQEKDCVLEFAKNIEMAKKQPKNT